MKIDKISNSKNFFKKLSEFIFFPISPSSAWKKNDEKKLEMELELVRKESYFFSYPPELSIEKTNQKIFKYPGGSCI